MKFLLLVLCVAGLTGCSLAESVNSNCGGDARTFCDATFGTKDAEQDLVDEGHTERLELLEAQIQALDFQFVNMQAQVNLLTQMQQANNVNLSALIQNAQNSANQVLVQLAALQSEQRIVAILDPCGDSPGYDEIILRTNTGKLLAYFEQGPQRFLTIVGTGNYATTDGSSCSFSVNSQGQLCDNLNCR